MVGKIVEYVPQQQTNGYLTYNFPYVQKMPPQQNPQQYLQQNQPPQQLNPTLPSSSSASVQYSNGRPVIPPAYTSQQDPNRRNFPPYQMTQTIQNNSSRYPTYPSNQLHSENNRPVFSPYSFPQHHQPPQDIRQTQPATYPIQMNTLPASTQPRVVPAYTHIQQNVPATPTIETSISTYVPVQRSERSGLDNLSLAAELILSSAIPSSTILDIRVHQFMQMDILYIHYHLLWRYMKIIIHQVVMRRMNLYMVKEIIKFWKKVNLMLKVT
ncbi:hypothetical protein RhiirC2_141104 [Rhizophagus irregularis]|uniref:Uncharacterized protein n=1 Tax=Rhizophagus irregularis TaxID=588596 RepID=A0A2N1NSA5_9GLOM|nr:hypothetical protein RhiirC2_141104 [Rhizophagus irregularis]